MATMPNRPLLGASVATHTTGIRARDARRIQERKTCGPAGEGNDPIHIIPDRRFKRLFVAFAETGIIAKFDFDILQENGSGRLSNSGSHLIPKTMSYPAGC